MNCVVAPHWSNLDIAGPDIGSYEIGSNSTITFFKAKQCTVLCFCYLCVYVNFCDGIQGKMSVWKAVSLRLPVRSPSEHSRRVARCGLCGHWSCVWFHLFTRPLMFEHCYPSSPVILHVYCIANLAWQPAMSCKHGSQLGVFVCGHKHICSSVCLPHAS